MKKSFLALSLMVLSLIFFFSCSKKEEKKGENVSSLNATDKNIEENVETFEDIGFKVRMPKQLSSGMEGNINLVQLGNDSIEDEPIFGAYLYQYISDATRQDLSTILTDTSIEKQDIDSKIENEVYPRVKDLFTLATLRADVVKNDDEIKEILVISDIKILAKTEKYIQVIGLSDGSDVENLTEEEQKQYKELLSLSKSIVDSIEVMEPKSKSEALQSITGLNFKTQDLEGKEVTSEIFKVADVTMVNIWATWCAPCKAELPDIGRVAKKYREKGGQVVAICSDVTEDDDSALDEAKEIIADSECDFVVLKKNSSLDSIFNNIQAYPTSLFFDKNGNLIGSIVVGSRSEAEFEALFDEMLAQHVKN